MPTLEEKPKVKIKFDISLKKKWIAALLSDEYTQGKNCLRSVDNEYCCLGVLCDVYDNKLWDTKKTVTLCGYDLETNKSRKLKSYTYRFGDDISVNYISNNLCSRVGLSWNDEEILVRLNDEGKSFKEIAKWIKATFNIGYFNVTKFRVNQTVDVYFGSKEEWTIIRGTIKSFFRFDLREWVTLEIDGKNGQFKLQTPVNLLRVA